MIPVTIHAADGWVTIWHTQAEYEALWKDVDTEVAMAMDGFNRP
jgi:hypothetical protein